MLAQSRLGFIASILFVLAFGFISSTGYAQELNRLRVADNNRYLEYENGDPFLYIGDTAWELFHRLNREEAELYLNNRAEKGFTVIQAVAYPQLGNLKEANAYGHLPLINRDPAQPNEDYFKHVDFIVNKAEELGLVVGFLPTWGSYWDNNNRIFTVKNARAYANYLGKRYKNKPIIWILGGDSTIKNDLELDIISAMANGLREGDGGAHLITFHPRGPGQSSLKVHNQDWLDFNMIQSSHAAHNHDTGLFVEHDLAQTPLKPTLDGEPRYECINAGFYFKDWNRYDRFDDFDSRQAAYWAMMAGACGHTYGNNNIWQMWAPGRGAVIDANIHWRDALDHPGAFQMKHLRKLFESYDFRKLVSDNSFIVDAPRSGGAKVRGIHASDGSFAFVYTPYGEPFTVNSSVIKKPRVKETWFDPRYGVSYHIHTSENLGFQTYTPPCSASGRGNDWVLVLEGE
ncbi:MAG: glycoside hydrolase family 140 protein [Candidatus Hinthialibacter antarcticus]|nr:glycoside hydrolase family 140 protein [Candidatus Hinthialibacter antarcticus]